MAPIMLIPLEIRLQIYGYPLVDLDYYGNGEVWLDYEKDEHFYHSIPEPPSASEIRVIPRHRWAKDFSFQNALLRTSHQIYEEAITVLYGKNVFLYSNFMRYPNNLLAACGLKEAIFPHKHLSLIRYLRLQVNQCSRCWVLQHFVDPIIVISREMQTLTALNVTFCFKPRCPWENMKEGLKPLPDAVSSCSEILAAITGIDAHQEIQINVFDIDRETTMEAFTIDCCREGLAHTV